MTADSANRNMTGLASLTIRNSNLEKTIVPNITCPTANPVAMEDIIMVPDVGNWAYIVFASLG